MFRNPTAFIIGAGASWHYGYPTGEKLVQDVIERSERAEVFFAHSSNNPINPHLPNYLEPRTYVDHSYEDLKRLWGGAASEVKELRLRLKQVDPLVIDYFLGQNPKLQTIGKLLIAWVILEADARWQKTRRNYNRLPVITPPSRVALPPRGGDNWYRFVVNKLVTDCKQSSDLLKNKVSFITFNYDTSLEHHLYETLSRIEMFEETDVQKFLSGNRVTHIYGRVKDCPPDFAPIDIQSLEDSPSDYQLNDNRHRVAFKEFLDRVFLASKTINVISPDDKDQNSKEIVAAQQMLDKARIVFILGYGFDKNNNERLGLRQRVGHPKRKAVLFTNFEDINRVNKSASQLLLSRPDEFLSKSLRGTLSSGRYYEKSTRNVYDALAKDFDALEEAKVQAWGKNQNQ